MTNKVMNQNNKSNKKICKLLSQINKKYKQ